MIIPSKYLTIPLITILFSGLMGCEEKGSNTAASKEIEGVMVTDSIVNLTEEAKLVFEEDQKQVARANEAPAEIVEKKREPEAKTFTLCIGEDSVILCQTPGLPISGKAILLAGEKLHLDDSLMNKGIDYYTVFDPSKYYHIYVKSAKGKGELHGFIRGSQIAKAISCDIDGDGDAELIGFRYTGGKTASGADDMEQPAEIAIFKEGRVHSTMGIKAYSGNGFKNWGEVGFKPNLKVLSLEFGLEACDHPKGTYIFGINENGNLIPVTLQFSSGNEVASTFNNFVFPLDSGGQPNQLVVVSHTQNDEEKTHYRENHVFSFDGSRFIEIKGKAGRGGGR